MKSRERRDLIGGLSGGVGAAARRGCGRCQHVNTRTPRAPDDDGSCTINAEFSARCTSNAGSTTHTHAHRRARARTRSRSRRANGGTPTQVTERTGRCRKDCQLAQLVAWRTCEICGLLVHDENVKEKVENGNGGGAAPISVHNASNSDGWQSECLEKGNVVYK